MNTKKKDSNTHTDYFFPNPSIQMLCINHGTLEKLKKNTVIFDEHSDDETLYVYYIAQGICSVSGFSTGGREQTFLYQKEGELVGHVPYLLPRDDQSHPYAFRRPTILTKTNCVLFKIPHEAFTEHLHNSPEFSLYLNQLLAHNYSTTLAHLKQMQEDSAVGSICRFLLQISSPSQDGFLVPKLFTYGEIARFLGIHEVTVSKVVGRLKQEQLLFGTKAGLFIKDSSAIEKIIRHPETFHYK